MFSQSAQRQFNDSGGRDNTLELQLLDFAWSTTDREHRTRGNDGPMDLNYPGQHRVSREVTPEPSEFWCNFHHQAQMRIVFVLRQYRWKGVV